MRRVAMIFYPENHSNGDAVRRGLSNKNQRLLLDNSIGASEDKSSQEEMIFPAPDCFLIRLLQSFSSRIR